MRTYTTDHNINYTIDFVHISDIVKGDTVEHNGVLKTVCNNNIKSDLFLGTTLFGDSYNGGRKPVKLAKIIHVRA